MCCHDSNPRGGTDVVEQVRSLADAVEQAVSMAMAGALPPEFASEDPLVRRSDHADFQSNVALSLAKRVGEKPRDLAVRLAEQLGGVSRITSVEVSGPGFLNISLADEVLLEQLVQRQAHAKLGVAETQADQVITIDYSAPNVAKEMHVGHLRSTLIGDALARVLGFLGAEVIRQNHVGDWGTQFGMLIQYLVEHPGLSWRSTEVDGASGASVSALDALYRTARAEFDADEQFKEHAQRRVVALQSGDADTLAWWREIVAESEAAFQQIYQRLGVLLTLEDVYGESFYNPLLTDTVDELRDLGILERSEGALVVFFDDILSPEGQPVPLLVQKTDGGFGYGATDLATIRYRIQKRKATRLLYVVDARQAQHFEMIFKTARRAGWLSDDTEAQHVQFGTVLGSDGRPFKTRSGGTVRLADLLDAALQRAREVVAEKDPDLNEAELSAIAQVASVGAVKYAELSTSRTKDYVFDVDRMVSFNGQTGVYLQYMHTRIASIQRKAVDTATTEAHFDPSLALHPSERGLALLLDEFSSTLDEVSATLEPHRLANYLYSLARAFSEFYDACSVLQAESKATRSNRLALCELTRRTLAQGLDLLGIEAPGRM